MDRVAVDDLAANPHAVAFPDAEPRVIRLALEAGESVDPHRHPGREIVLYLRRGRIELRLDGESHEVAAGDVVRFDGDRDISPRALEGSDALLVLAERAGE